jgi:hypothetical protein
LNQLDKYYCIPAIRPDGQSREPATAGCAASKQRRCSALRAHQPASKCIEIQFQKNDGYRSMFVLVVKRVAPRQAFDPRRRAQPLRVIIMRRSEDARNPW